MRTSPVQTPAPRRHRSPNAPELATRLPSSAISKAHAAILAEPTALIRRSYNCFHFAVILSLGFAVF